MEPHEDENPIYIAPRDQEFTQLIISLLKLGKLKQEYIVKILNEEGMNLYSQIFTHSTANSELNYEPYEMLGDSTANCCIVWYLSRRFPRLDCPEGVKVIARLKINLVSKKSFAEFGNVLGFWKFISADQETRENKMKPTLEDVFEAFFGATQYLLDKNIQRGVGYTICYNIIQNLFDQREISLRYEDLYDPKTRLKETFDLYAKEGIGQVKYENERVERIQNVIVYRIDQRTHTKEVIGRGSAALKAAAEQVAAENALITLKRRGIEKPIPEFYKTLCK